MTGERGDGSGREAFEARLPSLGPRGEGWIAVQMVLEIGALVVAVMTGGALAGVPRAAAAVAGVGLLVGGVLLFAWGAAHLGRVFSVWVTPRADGALVTSGPYRWARHPICTAQVLIVAGWSLCCASLPGLLMAPVIAVYLDRFKLAREEQTLLATYPAYGEYMAAVAHRMWPSRPGVQRRASPLPR